jgi:hypothetical protein
MFPIVGFSARQILGVVECQIETERIFSLVGKLTNLRGCHLQIENLEKLIFVNKNWLDDAIIGCKSPSTLVEFLEKAVNLEEEFEEFEGEFEKDEVVEV